MKQFPSSGPFPKKIEAKTNKIHISFDQVHICTALHNFASKVFQKFILMNKNYTGFYICTKRNFEHCHLRNLRRHQKQDWQELPTSKVTFFPNLGKVVISVKKKVSGIAYLWTDNPVGEVETLPIYAIEEKLQLPAAPFKWEIHV